jgi:alpha-galactosidase
MRYVKPVKIVMIGAASSSFGPGCLADAVQCEGIRGSRLVLVDIDEERLEIITKFAERLNEEADAGLIIESTTERKEALPEADFVFCSIALERNDLWKLDWEIPRRYGIKQVLGENGGPGGLSHTLRNIPVILDICYDMERLCPDAWLLNFTNPESRICLAISKYTSIKAAGLCHGVFMGIDNVSQITGVDRDDIDVKAAGLNHFTWMLAINRRSTGEDLYPLVHEKIDENASNFPLIRELYHKFGLLANPSDDHVGEYLSFAGDIVGYEGYDFAAADKARDGLWKRLSSMANGEMSVHEYLMRKSGEIALDIVRAMTINENLFIEAVNIPNNGAITNLPPDAVVEVPALVSASGIHPLCVGELPEAIADMCNTQIAVQRLAVDAAVTGSRKLALQAMLLDPVIDNMDSAEKCLDELLRVHVRYLPRFFS